MTTNEMLNLVEEINEYDTLLEELKDIIAAKEQILKDLMTAADTEEMNVADKYFIRFQSIRRANFNTSLFKKEHEETWKEYLRYTDTKRFSITAA